MRIRKWFIPSSISEDERSLSLSFSLSLSDSSFERTAEIMKKQTLKKLEFLSINFEPLSDEWTAQNGWYKQFIK